MEYGGPVSVRYVFFWFVILISSTGWIISSFLSALPHFLSTAFVFSSLFDASFQTPAGLLQSDSYYDFLEIAVLACFCAVHNHGFDTLFSFSAIVQHTPCPPVGFSILKAGLNKSVLLSVYASSTNRDHNPDHSHGMDFLSANSWLLYVSNGKRRN